MRLGPFQIPLVVHLETRFFIYLPAKLLCVCIFFDAKCLKFNWKLHTFNFNFNEGWYFHLCRSSLLSWHLKLLFISISQIKTDGQYLQEIQQLRATVFLIACNYTISNLKWKVKTKNKRRHWNGVCTRVHNFVTCNLPDEFFELKMITSIWVDSLMDKYVQVSAFPIISFKSW